MKIHCKRQPIYTTFTEKDQFTENFRWLAAVITLYIDPWVFKFNNIESKSFFQSQITVYNM